MTKPMGFLFLCALCAACETPPGEPIPEDAGEPVGDAAVVEMPDAFAETADAGSADAGPPPRCIGSYAEGVAVFAAESYLALRAHVDPEESAEVTAWPWQTSLGSVRPVAREVEWRLAGDTAMFRAEPLPDPRERRLRIAALADALDMGGREPILTVRACVANPCPEHAADGSPCRCEPEVCSPLFLAAGVPVLDGRWEFTEDGEAVGEFALVQDGRTLSGMPYDFPMQVEGVGVQGGELGIQVHGAIAADRRSITGLRLSEDGSDVIGPWSAYRVD